MVNMLYRNAVILMQPTPRLHRTRSWPGQVAWNLTCLDPEAEANYHRSVSGQGSCAPRACLRVLLMAMPVVRSLRHQHSGYVLACLPLCAWAVMHCAAAHQYLISRSRLSAVDLAAQAYLWLLALAMASFKDPPAGASTLQRFAAPAMVLLMQSYDAVLFLPVVAAALPSAAVSVIGTIAYNYILYLKAGGLTDDSFDEQVRVLHLCVLAAALSRLVAFGAVYLLEARQLCTFLRAARPHGPE